MSAYIITVIAAAVIISVTEIVFPDGKTSKYIKYVSGLIVLTVISSPLISHIGGEGDRSITISLPEYETFEDIDAYEALAKATESEIRETIESELEDVSANVTAGAFYDGEDYIISVEKIIITAKSGSLLDAQNVIQEYSEKYSCEVTVTYE
ncbi:MAG: stage III sporulation protein AF [Firmicutes bacterium]|nr:stage III sporulation protein AF [Bacillota bacterium]